MRAPASPLALSFSCTAAAAAAIPLGFSRRCLVAVSLAVVASGCSTAVSSPAHCRVPLSGAAISSGRICTTTIAAASRRGFSRVRGHSVSAAAFAMKLLGCFPSFCVPLVLLALNAVAAAAARVAAVVAAVGAAAVAALLIPLSVAELVAGCKVYNADATAAVIL